MKEGLFGAGMAVVWVLCIMLWADPQFSFLKHLWGIFQ